MERALVSIREALVPLLEGRGWTFGPLEVRGRIRLPVQRRTDGTRVFDAILHPKLAARRGGCYCETAHFYLYYALPAGAPAPADQDGLDELMRRLAVLLAGAERRLGRRAIEAFVREQATGDDPAEEPDGLARRVLEPGGGAEPQHILRVTFACNQRCPFCFVALGTKAPRLAAIARHLEHLRLHGPTDAVLTISGGEPTLDRRLERILRLARRTGFPRLEIQTNAVAFAAPGAVERLGPASYFVSFHSHLAQVYDRLTASQGQFPAALQGIRTLLAAAPGAVTFNLVLTRPNHAALPDYVRFLDGLRPPGGRPLAVFFTLMNDTGHLRAPDLAVSLEDLREPLERALAVGRELGVEVASFAGECAPPLCVLGNPAAYASARSFPDDDVGYAEAAEGAAVRRAKQPACRSCRYDARCRGVPPAYARRFGLEALRPFA